MNDLIKEETSKASLYNSLAQAFNYPDDVLASDLASGQFLKALETATTYAIDGHQLELRAADGALAVTGTRIAR